MVKKQNLINLNWKPTQMVVEPKKKEELNPLEMLKKSNFDNPISVDGFVIGLRHCYLF
jgi:hypothetical protein